MVGERPVRVAVVGAGSAGLAMAQQLLEVGRETGVRPVVFERENVLGGLWQYCADPGPCTVHVPSDTRHATAGFADWAAHPLRPSSAMYDGLRTNIPSDIMAYRDAPFPAQRSLFPARKDVLSYLETFAKDHGLEKYVRFRSEVVHVARANGAWRVTSRGASGERCEEYDGVVCAQGRCTVPYVPVIPGLAHFKGRQVHSAWYRTPTVFRGERVLIVGNNSSGGDIARELCGGTVRTFPGYEAWQRACEDAPPVQVYQSYHNPDEPPPVDLDPRDPASPAWCRRIHVVGPIARVDADGSVVLADKTTLHVDTIVWATGFLYQIPFSTHGAPFDAAPLLPPVGTPGVHCAPALRAASILDNLDDWLLFYKHAPGLCFLGLPNRIVPFPLTQMQSRVVAHVLLNKIPSLPRARADLPLTDAARWVPQDNSQAPGPEVWRNFTFGAASEIAYNDALLALLPAPESRQRPPGEEAYLEQGDGRGGGPHPPEHWYQFGQWRRDRRTSGKALRHEELKY